MSPAITLLGLGRLTAVPIEARIVRRKEIEQEITLARIVQAGVVPMDTAMVASKLQKTWHREDAQASAEVYTKVFAPYLLLIESYLKAQQVRKDQEQLDSQRS